MSSSVLVVDDDIQIGICLRRLLRGHDVQHASTGAQALTLLIAGGRYDVIFVDVGLTDMTGMELVKSVDRIAADQSAQIVFITGGDTRAVSRQYPRHLVLEKPFDVAAVRALADAALLPAA
ncbi:MAG: fixL4 [Myxococcales bacterium]|nr:fixL4 [Myxococcales bacterium]